MRRLRAWIFRERLHRDVKKELQFHIAEHARHLMAAGLSHEEATRRARLELGGLQQTAEYVRDGRAGAWLDDLVRDLHEAARSLRRTPALTGTVMLLIALVIGANTTVFSVVHGILTKPAPGVGAEHLVTIDLFVNGRPADGGNSYPNYLDYASQSTTVRSFAVDEYVRFTLSTSAGSYAIRGNAVSTNFFDTLGVQPILGRALRDADDLARSALPAVVSERLWQRQFSGAADIIGRSIALNGHAATIVGVAPPRFVGAITGESADVWVPLVAYARMNGTNRELADRSRMGMSIFGRLAPGASLAKARSEFEVISQRLRTTYPDSTAGELAFPITYSAIATGSLLSRQGDRLLAIFSIVTLLTVLIVCANVANLMLARGEARQRELAVRQSLGASRAHIVRTLVAEGIAVSLAAWALSCVCALVVSRGLARLLPPDPSGTTINADFTPDWKVAGYAMALALIGSVAFTLAPAIRTWRQDVLPWLKAGEHSVVQGRSRLSLVLVVVQLAFSVLLLTTAGLAYRSLSSMNALDLGFRTNGLLLASVNTAGSAATPDAHRRLLEQIRERLRSAPGFSSVSYVRWPGGSLDTPVRLSATEPSAPAEVNFVGPGYLEVLGLAPVTGREFTRDDRSRTNAVAIINQRLARQLWPGQPAIGRTLLVGSRQQPVEVVGVAPDVLFNGFTRNAQPHFVFRAETQEPGPPGETTFYVRFDGSLDVATRTFSGVLRDVDPNVPVVALRTLDAQLAGQKWPVVAIITMLIVFAAASLLIALIGQYAVVSFTTRRRTRDFGVRFALGASSWRILSSVLSEGLGLTAAGLLVGFGLSALAGVGLRRLLYGVGPSDPLTYLGVFVVLAAASLAACYLPAYRATRIDPMQALRQE